MTATISPTSMPAATPWSADGATTIIECLRRAARRRLVFLDDGLHAHHLTLAELGEQAEDRARALVGRLGVRPGDRVCLLGATSPAFIATLLAVWRAGAIAVVLPIPPRLDLASLRREVIRRVVAARSRLVLTTAGLADAGVELPGVTVCGYDPLPGTPGTALPPDPAPDDIGLLQFTSGTTSTGKAVPVRHGQMVANPSRVLTELVGVRPGDVFASWLPFYHDMGVLSFIGAVGAGMDICVMGTQTFVKRPAAWLQAVSRYRVAVTAAPNFAYGLAASHLALDRSALDLSSLRCTVNGAEVVDRGTLERFVAAAAQRGMAANAMCPMYGLAEATLAVSVTSPAEPARFLRVDRDALAAGAVVEAAEGAGGRDLACCGRPLPGTSVVVTDEHGGPVPAGAVGEIRVSGPGVVGAYWAPAGEAAPEPMCDRHGRLMTGDLGFVRDGELYVSGRVKDMVIVGGRNLYPEDYELLAEQVPGVRAGNVMAFSLPDSERMVVVAETRLAGAQAAGAARQMLDTLRQELSYAPYEAVLVPPGTLPKTSSGKRCRRRCRSDYQQGRLDVVASVR